MAHILVSGSFDNLRSPHIRFLHAASRLDDLHILLWSDAVVRAVQGREPAFPQEERLYFLDSIRYVENVRLVENLPDADALPEDISPGAAWAVLEADDTPEKRSRCQQLGMAYHVIPPQQLEGFPAEPPPPDSAPGRKKVIVTGCFDWLHSGHVRFFEEVSQLGDLYVAAGNDANVRLLKGEGHPLFSQEERRYMVQAIRFVKEALITSGTGWMDAEPEIERLRPDIYAVNEDGDKPEKRAFCEAHGLEYVVLKRLPKEGLPRRESTKLRGF
jgi:cytidyltransferase-like protein